MKIDDLLKQTSEWLKAEGPKSEIVVSSRIRVARNIEKVPFSHWAKPQQKEETLSKIKKAVDDSKFLKGSLYHRMDEISEVDRQFLIERHLMSREHAFNPRHKGIVIDKKEIVTVMINEEDHIRAQVMQSGFNLKGAWDIMNRIDTELSRKLSYAYSPKWGYLTACPTNVGTGMRASCMLHLPALVLSSQINKVLQAVSKLSLAVRGLYGEGTEASGNFFQISNQISLGLKEEEVIDNIEKIINQVVAREESARKNILSQRKEELTDRIFRSLGTLKNAYIISSTETNRLLSNIRLGVDLGIIKELDDRFVNELFILTQPAHLQKIEKKALSSKDRDVKRAEIIRLKLNAKE
jgi:protein arginine kinase